jgi:hypothetical protein
MKDDLERALETTDGVDLLARIVASLRPRRKARDNSANLRELVAVLDADPDLTSRLRVRVRAALGSLRLVHVVLDSGIQSERGIYDELKARVGGRSRPSRQPFLSSVATRSSWGDGMDAKTYRLRVGFCLPTIRSLVAIADGCAKCREPLQQGLSTASRKSVRRDGCKLAESWTSFWDRFAAEISGPKSALAYSAY